MALSFDVDKYWQPVQLPVRSFCSQQSDRSSSSATLNESLNGDDTSILSENDGDKTIVESEESEFAALKNGDYAKLRRSLRAAHRSTVVFDRRFVENLRAMTKSQLDVDVARRLRKGLLDMDNWEHLPRQSKSALRSLIAHVIALEIYHISLHSKSALPEVRARVNYLIDLIDKDLLTGTVLATILHLPYRSLRYEDRRKQASPMFQRVIRSLQREIPLRFAELEIPIDTSSGNS
ncbi:unnamed protein product, partial [Mesorhabditis spiculigera]